MIQENNIVICKNFPTFIEPRDACRKQHLHRYWRVSSFYLLSWKDSGIQWTGLTYVQCKRSGRTSDQNIGSSTRKSHCKYLASENWCLLASLTFIFFFSLDHRYQCRSRPKSRERTWSRQCLLSRLSGCDAQGKYMIQGSSIRNSQVCLSFLC